MILPNEWYREDSRLLVNPTGKFVIGGPVGDTGLTGRKIIVDTYGGAAPHGGGAFSGKDPTKVDRSAAYASRYLAKNIVYSGISDRCTIQLSYAIGVSEPLSIFVDLHGSNIIESNNVHLNWTVNQLISLKNNNNLEKIVLVGAAFKENTDDLRNSPTLDIYKILVDMGVQVSILDTEIEVPNHNYVSSVEEVDSKSLIAIMYPLNDELDKKLLDYTSQNDCIIFYPWR